MLSNLGNLLLFINVILGLAIIYFSFQNLKNNKTLVTKNIYHICLLQSSFIIICFFTFIIINEDTIIAILV